MSPNTLVFAPPHSEAAQTWPRLAPFLSESRWEMVEERGGEGRVFHGFASRHHPRRRAFRAGSGGLLRLALSDGPVQLVVGSPDHGSAESFVDELQRYARTFARLPEHVSILAEPDRPGWRLDPGRTLGLQHPGRSWTALCVRFSTPPFGLLMATHAYLWLRDGYHTSFARLHADDDANCIFCGHIAARASEHHLSVRSGALGPASLRDGCAGVFLEAG